MDETVKIAATIPKALFDQLEMLVERLNITPDDLFVTALENFIRKHDEIETGAEAKIINQGDIYWLKGLDSDIPHPHVIIQDNLLNHSRIHTVAACALTSNLKRVNIPGNVLLDAGEANLPRQSVVEVSKVSSIDKVQLGKYVGTLTESRIQQIVAGMRFVQRSFLPI